MTKAHESKETKSEAGAGPREGAAVAETPSALSRLRAALPKSLKRRLRYWGLYPLFRFRLWRNVAYDCRRFRVWSSADGRMEAQAQLRAWINADYHKIEKALALRAPRPGFGVAVVTRLTEHLERYRERFGLDQVARVAVNTLSRYLEFNDRAGIANPRLKRKVDAFKAAADRESLAAAGGGVAEVTRRDIHARGKMDLKDFFASRHSVRQFSPEPVPRDWIERAVEMAQKTPTVCNRQSLKVYAFDDPAERRRVLDCQKGNAGFGQEIGVALVVTSDVQTFFSVGERNQCWIDGGLFSMSLVYALHSLGLGSICLNWSVEKESDAALRGVAGIPESEAIIMLIGVGQLPERFTVAQSPRKPRDEVLFWGSKGGEPAATEESE